MSTHSPTSSTIFATTHALERWADRTPDGAPTIGAAWREAWQIALPTPEYRNVDAGRYHESTNTVLLVNDDRVRTVLSMDPDEISSWKAAALWDAVEAQFGVDTGAVTISYSGQECIHE